MKKWIHAFSTGLSLGLLVALFYRTQARQAQQQAEDALLSQALYEEPRTGWHLGPRRPGHSPAPRPAPEDWSSPYSPIGRLPGRYNPLEDSLPDDDTPDRF
ncbi:MAG: hypothetical protein MUE40_13695 [Anaerolineae bacterium]|jgi:hypothetical protein|nr:hypothetical protein [Anaerolineae bacterium]